MEEGKLIRSWQVCVCVCVCARARALVHCDKQPAVRENGAARGARLASRLAGAARCAPSSEKRE